MYPAAAPPISPKARSCMKYSHGYSFNIRFEVPKRCLKPALALQKGSYYAVGTKNGTKNGQNNLF